ncbi:MAG: hypothetical protein U0269_36965 [Polyangiales bacterium]
MTVEPELASFESAGLRWIVLRGDLERVRGLFVGVCAPDRAATFESVRALSRYGEELRAQDIVALDPRDDGARWRFHCEGVCRACVAYGDERLLLIEDRSLVARRQDGDGREVLFADALGDEEVLIGTIETDHRCAVLLVATDEERFSCRVIDLERRALRWSNEFSAMAASVLLIDGVVIVRSWGEYDERFNEAFDGETGEQRWTRVGDLDRGGLWEDLDEARDGAVAIRDPESDELAVIDVATGAVRFVGDRARAWVDAAHPYVVAVDANERARIIESERGETIANLALAQRLLRVHALDDERMVLVGTQSVVLVGAAPPRVLAGVRIVRGGIEVPPRVRVGDGWIALVCHPDIEVELEPLSLDRAPRIVRELSALSLAPTRVTLSLDSVIEQARRAEGRSMWPVDRARFEAILEIARDERWNDAAAWERLVARDLVRAEPSWSELAVHQWVRSPLLSRTSVDHTLESPDERGAWLAMAHDFERVVTATTLGRELIASLRPWVFAVPKTVEWCVPSMAGNVLWSLCERAESCVQSVVTCDGLAGVAGWIETLYVAQALWTEASALGLALPETAPSSLAGRSFAQVRSPFAACIALHELGIELVDYDERSLVLGLLAIDERGERVRSDSEDIPF